MADEYAHKNEAGEWVSGFTSRRAAVNAGLSTGKTQVITAQVEDSSPSYFARFEGQSVLSRMISGLEEGEKLGKLVGGKPAQDFLRPILAAGPGDDLFEDKVPKAWHLQIDLMDRLEAAAEAWFVENNLAFVKPKFIRYASEELHVSGPNLDVPLL
ncbi:MAG: hypothetical protein JWR21_588 [Herminiimonas sp.]|nr:hypothetical protein [Herminiimonas sp.]MDB5855822.1 hypothetical protein [Herminiimonas sp.]